MRRITCILLALLTAGAARAQSDLWTDLAEGQVPQVGNRDVVPLQGRTLAADVLALRALLVSAPLAGSANAQAAPLIVALPLPGGGFGRFQVEEAPMMEAPLAAKFPALRTFRVRGIDDPSATGRLDLTPAGFHAMVLSSRGSFWIDPFQRGDDGHYVVYYRKDYARDVPPELSCLVHGRPGGGKGAGVDGGIGPVNGGTLRTYRAAVAATIEYTDFHSAGAPTVAEGLAAIVTAMNRVNGIYEREVSATMVLVANNDDIVHTTSDPYSNNNGGAMLGQNQANIDAVIGSANYDIGHVFSTGGGGVAFLGVVCTDGSKAGGVTGLPAPVGDIFYVDFVAHEMGHQFDGTHTFNSEAGNCGGGNREAATAYEPGSGSTIMAYAGICGSQDLQNNSDDYFHTISLQQIVSFTNTGLGDGCAVESATGNNPASAEAGPSYTIPISTPFELCGSGSDPDLDPLTFNWEQFNIGPAGDAQTPSGNAPIFRSWPATTSPCRTFPRLSDLLAGTSVIGELLPTYSRTMTFRLTARDNVAGGGAIATDQVNVVVSALSGPFQVTSPNTAVSLLPGAQTVTWNVASTDLAPVSCSQVDVLYSNDGGLSFPFTLASATGNDGSEVVIVPGTSNTQARIKVRCTGNVFFDVSNVNFTVAGADGLFADGFESGDSSAWSVTVP